MLKFHATGIRRAIALLGLAAFISACQVPSKPLQLSDSPSASPSDQVIGYESKIPTASEPRVSESTAVITPAAPAEEAKVPTPEPSAQNKDAQENLFADIAKVLQHPRCLNCHVSGNTPKQGDDRHDHMPPVQRGADGRGAGLTCNVCHQASNGPVAPGAPDWHLAPLEMAWEGLSVGELCRSVTNPAKNGGRDLNALTKHLTTDPLVQWGWSPGGSRKPVPLSKTDFAQLVGRWVESGGACPN